MQTTTETRHAANSLPMLLEDEETEFSNVRRWTKPEYYKLAELGFFDNMRVELIGGEIIVNTDYEVTQKGDEIFMVMNNPHAVAIRLITAALRKIFGEKYLVDSQLPLNLGEVTEPQPDLAVVEGQPRDFIESHPSAALLLVEVSETTLRFDRLKKASLYAAGGIQDYWIVNLKKRQVEIYRRPAKDETAAFGFSYAEIKIFFEDEEVSPLAAPEAKIKVADLLP